MPTSPNTVPTYKIGGDVYVVVSAQIGHLEKYQVESIVWDEVTSQWGYVINNRRAAEPTPPTNALGFGPRPGNSKIGFRESELTDFCGAADLVEAHHEAKLASILLLKAAQNCDGTGGTTG